jgi:hypothetical protein
MLVTIRDFQPLDAAAVNTVSVAAFAQFAAHYSDWPAFSKKLANTSALADHGELIVADAEGAVIGAEAYISASRPKSAFGFLRAAPDVHGVPYGVYTKRLVA